MISTDERLVLMLVIPFSCLQVLSCNQLFVERLLLRGIHSVVVSKVLLTLVSWQLSFSFALNWVTDIVSSHWHLHLCRNTVPAPEHLFFPSLAVATRCRLKFFSVTLTDNVDPKESKQWAARQANL